ncbi:MAG TPA: xanthine dehydrogenase accessory protein XdhC [Noviherbaspirillum sp.]|nr:xanthine dehydrogenase accessory protein XdhC [Noviherbaspirillum sp.]
MPAWLTAITSRADAAPAVLVTVASVEGSAPREPGAKMLVTPTAQYDTIGGGHVELRACAIAREMLAVLPAQSASQPSDRRIERFALGPSLGQCCGGVVHLAFEYVTASTRAYYAHLHAQWHERQDCWRLVPLDTALPSVLVDDSGNVLAGNQPAAPLPPLPPLHFERNRPCHLLRDAAGHAWLIDPCRVPRSQLLLFGAGHVGAALVRALADLPCHVTWIDVRDDIFPDDLPLNVTIEVTDTPEAVVDAAPAGSNYLVLTHSHALDLRLAEAILRRSDVGWFGLIGSTTKRRQFEHRLRERGIASERLADMVCPIGIPGISGKAPAVIAASVAAQLLQVWEAQENDQHGIPIRRTQTNIVESME